ncbi:MAG: hypothetical protein RLZZ127_220 [Planctomycetota bacterium]|jgi:hypothetical protein
MDSLLVLVLALDPVAEPAAQAVARDLAAPGWTVGSATAARAALDQAGLTVADLAANPAVASAWTRTRPVALVGIRTLDAEGAAVDARVAVAGTIIPYTAIAPTATQARLAAGRGIRDALAGAGAGPEAGEDRRLADMAQRADWAGILAAVPATAAAARPQFYRVKALARLGRREEARQAAEVLRTAHPGHVLAAAAADLIPPAGPDLGADALPGDDGSNTLR